MERIGVTYAGAVVSISGEIDMASGDCLSSALAPAVEAGGPVVLDISAVTFMDSSGLHAILRAAQGLSGRGCVIIHGAHGAVARVAELTGLSAVQPNIHVIDCAVLALA